MKMDTKRFDLTSALKQNNKDVAQQLSPELIDRATRVVVNALTDFKGSSKEIDMHNSMLARCAIGDKSAQVQVKAMIKKIIETDHRIAQPPLSDMLVKKIYEDNYGLGAIDDLVNDPTVNEIQVNGKEHIWVERGGIKERVKGRQFKSDEDVERIIRLLLQFDRKEVTAQDPMKESRMADGSRLTVQITPVGKRPYVAIRKFDAFDVTTESLLDVGTLTSEMVDWLQKAVKGRSNILIIGETGSGKTSLLKWLIEFISPRLRLGTIETNFELKLDEKYPERNIFSFEEHPEIEVTMSQLFYACLRMSPDIIICGEARGPEADELIRAMRRGHPGSLGTIHTNEPETAIDDMAEMISEDGKRRDPQQLRYRIASALDLIVQIRRFEDTGKRRITRITEVVPNHDSYDYSLNDIWRYEVDPQDPSLGRFEKTGTITEQFKHKLNHFGLPMNDLQDM